MFSEAAVLTVVMMRVFRGCVAQLSVAGQVDGEVRLFCISCWASISQSRSLQLAHMQHHVAARRIERRLESFCVCERRLGRRGKGGLPTCLSRDRFIRVLVGVVVVALGRVPVARKIEGINKNRHKVSIDASPISPQLDLDTAFSNSLGSESESESGSGSGSGSEFSAATYLAVDLSIPHLTASTPS